MSGAAMELERDCLAIESCLCTRVVDYPPGHIRNFKNRNGTGGVAQVVEHLPCKLEAMNSNPRMTKTKYDPEMSVGQGPISPQPLLRLCVWMYASQSI
jgi:hypothetical protein